MTASSDDLVARLRAKITSYLYGSTLVYPPICLEAAARIAALEANKAALETLVADLRLALIKRDKIIAATLAKHGGTDDKAS